MSRRVCLGEDPLTRQLSADKEQIHQEVRSPEPEASGMAVAGEKGHGLGPCPYGVHLPGPVSSGETTHVPFLSDDEAILGDQNDLVLQFLRTFQSLAGGSLASQRRPCPEIIIKHSVWRRGPGTGVRSAPGGLASS